MSSNRNNISDKKRWVIKFGSSLLTNEGYGLKLDSVQQWVNQMKILHDKGIEVVIVSSGAVAEGIVRLGMKQRPRALHELQAAAAIGQMGLIQAYEQAFQTHNIHTAQVLLTHDEISDRQRYLNARSTLKTILDLGCVPVVNENDTVSTEEIQLGDNDNLAGLVCNLIEAVLLIILTDQDGLYDSDPRDNPEARLIKHGQAGDPDLETKAGAGGQWGRGGMKTKLKAASTAAKSGADTIIASGKEEDVLIRISVGDDIGTYLESSQAPLSARKQWLAGQNRIQGQLRLDNGAVEVLKDKGRSLLPVGVTQVDGNFRRGEIVGCFDESGQEMARGLVNYNADEIRRIMGHSSTEIDEILGYIDEPELIHRDNLILF